MYTSALLAVVLTQASLGGATSIPEKNFDQVRQRVSEAAADEWVRQFAIQRGQAYSRTDVNGVRSDSQQWRNQAATTGKHSPRQASPNDATPYKYNRTNRRTEPHPNIGQIIAVVLMLLAMYVALPYGIWRAFKARRKILVYGVAAVKRNAVSVKRNASSVANDADLLNRRRTAAQAVTNEDPSTASAA